MSSIYSESFESGLAGWVECYKNGRDGLRPHETNDGALVSKSPWWVDYNHAPPGGGYLHLLFTLHTADSRFRTSEVLEAGGANSYIDGGYPTDFTNARMTFQLRGDVKLHDAKCVLLIQSFIPEADSGEIRCVPYLLTGQPIAITPEYSEQTITLIPDTSQWTCLGSRHDRRETYGWGQLEEALANVNINIMLVLFPLEIVPAQPLDTKPHLLRAGEDFAVDRSRLPEGYVELSSVKIEFPQT